MVLQVLNRLSPARLPQFALMLCLCCAIAAGAGFKMGASQLQPMPPANVQVPPTGSAAVVAKPNDQLPVLLPVNSQPEQVVAQPGISRNFEPVLPATLSATTADAQAPLAVSPPPVRRPANRVRPVHVPLIFQAIDPAVVGLTTVQVADIDRMRSSFNAQVGQQNSSDPAYHQRWVSAQQSADEQLRSYLGWDKFNNYQIHAAQLR